MQFNDTAPIAFGLASAASWGAGDFCGGVATQRTGAYQVVIGSQLCGALALAGLAAVAGEVRPTAAGMAWCGVAGLAGAAGLLSLYQALARGRMGVAAPVSGVVSAALPVVAGGLFEGVPRSLTLVGFVLAFAGVWLVARTDSAAIRPGEFVLPAIAGIGFGCFIIVIGRASGGAVYWPLVAARMASLSVLTAIAAARASSVWPEPRQWRIIAMAGLFDAAGNAFLVLAAHAGRLDVAAVLSSMYPAGTVLLAWWILRERISRGQLAGLAAVLAAIALITTR
jgi:drug/metabolite transporter (DMT)-like permease